MTASPGRSPPPTAANGAGRLPGRARRSSGTRCRPAPPTGLPSVGSVVERDQHAAHHRARSRPTCSPAPRTGRPSRSGRRPAPSRSPSRSTPTAAGQLVNGANICVDPAKRARVERGQQHLLEHGDRDRAGPDLGQGRTTRAARSILGDSFTWTITASNGGERRGRLPGRRDDRRGHAAGRRHLRRCRAWARSTNVTNTAHITCAIVANVLTCTANGATVTIGATTGTFAVTFQATPTAAGQLVNGANICVDPDINVPESNEGNNTCSDTVTVTAPDLTSVKDEQHGRHGQSSVTASPGRSPPQQRRERRGRLPGRRDDRRGHAAGRRHLRGCRASGSLVERDQHRAHHLRDRGQRAHLHRERGDVVIVGATTGTFAVTFQVDPDRGRPARERREHLRRPGPERPRVERGQQHLLEHGHGDRARPDLGRRRTTRAARSIWVTASPGRSPPPTAANGAAVFQAGETIVGDTLPAGATYGAAERGPGSP